MQQFIPILIFVTVLLLIESLYYLYRERQFRAPQRVRERLTTALIQEEAGLQGTNPLLKQRIMSEIPTLNELLSRFKIFKALEVFLSQANCSWTVGRFLLTTLLVAMCGAYPTYLFLGRGIGKASIVGILVGSLPAIVLYVRKRNRELAFEEQLPDVLDLMGRALRAGHSIPGAIQFAGQESPEPVGPEFGRVSEEINFGMDIQTALKNLANRVNCYDLGYLIAALTIQRETGGNLTELLDRLSNLIRERFKLVRQTRALTAEGRLSGTILTVLPFAMGVILYLTQPDYILILFKDPTGRMLVTMALVMQVMGYLVIRNIVNLDKL